MAKASGFSAGQPQPRHQMIRAGPLPFGLKGSADLINETAPVGRSRNIHRHAGELGKAGQTFLHPHRTVVADRYQGDGLFAGLVDVSALRHAGHDHRFFPRWWVRVMDGPSAQ